MARPTAAAARGVLAMLVLTLLFIQPTISSCIPDVPAALLSDSTVLQHPAVVAALKDVELNLSSLYTGSAATRDGFSFAMAHASSPEKAFAFSGGRLKMNASDSDASMVDSDSIFRIASVSKNFAAFSALVVGNQSVSQNSLPALTLDTPVREVLPEFGLPETDWQNGGSEITLSMLGSHSSGLLREGYDTNFNMVSGLSRATATNIGADWAGVDPTTVIEHAKRNNLMFAPGQRAAYSNTGTCIMAYAVANYRNQLYGSNLTWTELVTQDILAPLNMTHSFFGAIPDSLVPYLSIPGAPNWIDLLVGPGYDPAGGMWSSANDLVNYIYSVWLQPTPELISVLQRRNVLQPKIILPDGKQQVGVGWEILVTKPTAQGATYNIYGKSGDGGSQHAWMDVVPNLGYGLAVLSSEGAPVSTNYTRIRPEDVATAAHSFLIPAFRTAYSDLLAKKYAGNYTLLSNQGQSQDNSESYALLQLEADVLYLRNLVVNGTSALLRADQLGWTASSHARFFSKAPGVGLNPSDAVWEKPGGQVMRTAVVLDECDWFDFDGYTDQNGWPLGKIVLVEGPQGMELHYPPFDAVFVRQE